MKPIESSYNAYARASLMAGDPEAAISRIDEMVDQSLGSLNWINAKDYAQAGLLLMSMTLFLYIFY